MATELEHGAAFVQLLPVRRRGIRDRRLDYAGAVAANSARALVIEQARTTLMTRAITNRRGVRALRVGAATETTRLGIAATLAEHHIEVLARCVAPDELVATTCCDLTGSAVNRDAGVRLAPHLAADITER
jgi:hypothetical protein